jgi:hypothetical protein
MSVIRVGHLRRKKYVVLAVGVAIVVELVHVLRSESREMLGDGAPQLDVSTDGIDSVRATEYVHHVRRCERLLLLTLEALHCVGVGVGVGVDMVGGGVGGAPRRAPFVQMRA